MSLEPAAADHRHVGMRAQELRRLSNPLRLQDAVAVKELDGFAIGKTGAQLAISSVSAACGVQSAVGRQLDRSHAKPLRRAHAFVSEAESA